MLHYVWRGFALGGHLVGIVCRKNRLGGHHTSHSPEYCDSTLMTPQGQIAMKPQGPLQQQCSVENGVVQSFVQMAILERKHMKCNARLTNSAQEHAPLH